MIRSPLLSIIIFMLIFSTMFAFLNFESPLRAIAQIDTITATKQPQPSSLGLAETPRVIEGNNISTILELLSTIIETRINKSTTVLEITSKIPEVTNNSYANEITEKFMGVPQYLDLQKRNVAKDILAQDKDMASIFFLTPKGDIYIGEPYSDQIQLPRLNYADRDWFKGVTSTNDTYTSAVFLSAAIHVPAIAMAVPVYGNTTGGDVSMSVKHMAPSVVGYWVGILDPAKIKEDLSALDLLSHGDEVVLVDHNGTQVFNILARIMNVSSPLSFENQSLKSYSQLQSVRNALDGKAGAAVEILNNTGKKVYYYPVQSQPHKWALLLLQPSQ